MSNPNEQEKLTQSSPKSYDGSTTPMAEESSEHENPNPENPDEPQGEDGAPDTNEDQEKQAERNAQKKAQKEEKAEGVAQLFRAIFASIKPQQNPEAKKIIAKVTQSVTNTESDPNEGVAKVLKIFLQNEPITPHSSDEELEQANARAEIFETVLDNAEETGLDREKIVDRLAVLTKHDNTQIPVTEEDRYAALEEYVKERIMEADEEAVEKMEEEWTMLRESIASDSSVDEKVVEAVTDGEALLKELHVSETEQLEAKEDISDQEQTEQYQQEFDKAFAEMIVRVLDAKAQETPEQKEEKNEAMDESEKAQAELMMNILLAPDNPKSDKKTVVATLLRVYYPREGIQKNEAIRDFILEQAEQAGLNRESIQSEEERVDISQETEVVNESESGISLNAFESLVEKQILNAEPGEVREIQNAWKKLLAHEKPDSEVAKKAEEAIAVLGNIIIFKEEVNNARTEGRPVDWDRIPPPSSFDAKEASVSSESTEEAKNKLISLFVTMFSTATPEDKSVIEKVTTFVIATENDYDKQVMKINTLLSCIPHVSQSTPEGFAATNVMGMVQEVAMLQGLSFHDIGLLEVQNTQMSAKDRQEKLQALFADSISNSSREKLEEIHDAWQNELDNPKLKVHMKPHIQDAVEQIETIVTTNTDTHATDLSREELIEKDVVQTADFAKKIDSMFSPEAMSSREDQSIDMLVILAIAPYRREGAKDDLYLAEKQIAKLLQAYPVDGEKGETASVSADIRQKILAYADKIGLDSREIFLENARLDENQGDTPRSNSIEDAIKISIGDANEKELHDIQKLWTKVLKSTKDEKQQNELQKSIETLGRVAKTKELLANGEPADPSVVFDLEAEKAKELKIDPDLQEKKAAQQAKRHELSEHIEEIDNAEMQDYLHNLINRLNEGMSADEAKEALELFNDQVKSIREAMKYEASDEDAQKAARDKIREFDIAVNPYKKLLKMEIRLAEEVDAQTRPAVEQKDIDAFLSRTNELNEQQRFAGWSVEEYQDYAQKLKEILATPGALSEAQLKSAYIALMTQATVLRHESERKGEFVDEFRNVQKEIKPVEALLLHELEKVNKEGREANLRQINDTLKEREVMYRNESGFTYAMEAKNIASMPVTQEANRYTGAPPVYIADAPDRIRNTDADAVVPAGISPQLETDVRQGIADMKHPEVFRAQERLAELQNQLAQLEVEGLANNRNPDGSPNFQAMKPARDLAIAINEQREALASLAGYKGIRERTAEMDPLLYGGMVHEALGERIRRVRVQFGDETGQPNERNYSDTELLAYYRELRTWAKTILDNDVRRNPNKIGRDTLRLSNERYERYKQIVDESTRKNMKFTDVAANRDLIRRDIQYLLRRDEQGGDYLRYFMQNVPHPELGSSDIQGLPYTPDNKYNPDGLLGVPYQRPMESGGDIPETLRETMAKIAKDFSNDTYDFHPGGNRQLIDQEGNFQYNNFIYWIRLKINEDVDYNNDAPIQPFGKIIIKLPMTQISMFELMLLIPEYTSQRKFEIKMPSGDSEEVFSSWGEKAENPNFGWADLDFIGQEMEFRQMTHEARIKYTNNNVSGDKEQFLQLMDQLHGANNWTRSSNIFRLLGYPSSVTNNNSTKEVDEWQKKERQGSIGKSMCDMLVAYNYLSELTDYHQIKERDDNGKETKRDKHFNENMFYKFLEPNGANKFLIKMAEGALNHNIEAKQKFISFIEKRINAAEQAYLAKGISDEQRSKISQIAREQRDNITGLSQDTIDKSTNFINFTENNYLTNFHKGVKREVLTDPAERDMNDRGIALQVRNELVEHLKEEYFTDLVNITVGKIDTIEKNNKTQDRDSSHVFLRTQGTTRFGDIDVGGMTMQEMLIGNDGFDVEQILRFDYSNDPNDPTFVRNPGRNVIGHKAQLRRALDEYMDKDRNTQNHKLFERNEKMMLAFTKHVTRIKRAELNHFRDQHENVVSRDMIKEAFQSFVEGVHGIDRTESEYAWWWTRDYVYLWGIGSSLDVTGIGFRQDGKLFNTGIWRPRRMAKDGGGNPHTYDEFLAMSLPFLHHVRVHNTHATDEERGHRSIFYWLQGGEGGYITPRAVREFEPRSHYTFAQGAEQQYVKNTLSSGSELVELLSKTEFDFTNILAFDLYGNVTFDYGKARDLFGKWRGAIRYAFGKNMLDYREKIWSGGREKTLYEHFFGPKTRALNELITRNIDKHTVDRMYKEPFDAFMMSVVAAEVYEHRKMFTSGHHWSIQNIVELEHFLLEFMDEKQQTENAEGEKHSESTGRLLTHKIFDAALNAYHTGYFKMYSVEFNSTFWGGLFGGLIEGLKASVKGIKPY